MMTPRENFLATVNHQPHDFVPDLALDTVMVGGAFETFENGPLGGGPDGFGLNWLCTASASGQAVPDPTCKVIPDILEWEKYLKIPDLDAYDWEGMAKMQLENTDRENKVVIYATWNSIFLRFSHLLGFEDALIAMYEEPEACIDMMSAICDYRCRLVEYIAKYFKPDFITNYDDVCTERGPFMSPSIYREMIKPFHKKFNDAVRSFGIFPGQHCCGLAEDLIGDFIEEGAVTWEAAQPINDIVKIQEKYGDKIVVLGGYNTNGKPGREGVTDEEIEAEVKRALDEYAPGGSFGMEAFLIANSPDPMTFVQGMIRIAQFTEKYRYDYYK